MLEEYEDDPKAVAARLAKVRTILGLTKREFAERAGISEQAYGPVENARRRLSYDQAKALRRTYSLNLEFIYFGNIQELPHRIAKEL